jgi:hypothetical protein
MATAIEKSQKLKFARRSKKNKLERLLGKHVDLEGIIRAHSDSAKGLMLVDPLGLPVRVVDSDGNEIFDANGQPIRIYRQSPDATSAKLLIEQWFGRPAQRESLEGEDVQRPQVVVILNKLPPESDQVVTQSAVVMSGFDGMAKRSGKK